MNIHKPYLAYCTLCQLSNSASTIAPEFLKAVVAGGLGPWCHDDSSSHGQQKSLSRCLFFLKGNRGVNQVPMKFHTLNMEVSESSGTSQSSVSMGFSMINHLFWRTPIYGTPLTMVNSCQLKIFNQPPGTTHRDPSHLLV